MAQPLVPLCRERRSDEHQRSEFRSKLSSKRQPLRSTFPYKNTPGETEGRSLRMANTGLHLQKGASRCPAAKRPLHAPFVWCIALFESKVIQLVEAKRDG